jgi:glutamate synthase domain-containing protein 2
MIFTDSVSLPFRLGFSRVYSIFAQRGLHEQIVFIGAGKLGLPDNAMVAFGLGVDMVNVGREAMLSIGCIQAQRCHTDSCPTGVATQNKWLSHGLDPTLKSERAANYIKTLRRDLMKVSEACGVEHPALLGPSAVEIINHLSRRAHARRGVRVRAGLGLPLQGRPGASRPADAAVGRGGDPD